MLRLAAAGSDGKGSVTLLRDVIREYEVRGALLLVLTAQDRPQRPDQPAPGVQDRQPKQAAGAHAGDAAAPDTAATAAHPGASCGAHLGPGRPVGVHEGGHAQGGDRGRDAAATVRPGAQQLHAKGAVIVA